jgi:hypothetical protein
MTRLQATPLLQWAARRSGEARLAELSTRHTGRVLDIHCRAGGSIIQPAGMVAYWDFDDPAISDTEYDTTATAIVGNALLKLGRLAPDAADRARYRAAGERTAFALVSAHLTPHWARRDTAARHAG